MQPDEEIGNRINPHKSGYYLLHGDKDESSSHSLIQTLCFVISCDRSSELCISTTPNPTVLYTFEVNPSNL